MIDGEFNDGGHTRQYGWTRIPVGFVVPTTAATAKVAPSVIGSVSALRVYDRYLRTSEAVSNWRAGPPR